eukprot:CAMPEP_0197606202 /NCGR_PEP_ID=MMETSP1326-20131121/44567_1 /TAXON_ID=1155430 /ORGANISM="Genus nov. species nov., Strain RCC2288" /LENGTH=83 /DNA_ID=CAMNT_0043174085 /DNA_START=80 /DNA_END=328 /DNA_ORIENTATION=-
MEMDDEMRDTAKEVFAALTAAAGNNMKWFEIFTDDFPSWRVFFRAVKELSQAPDSALAELSRGGFLGKHEINMSNWGKSVKER